MAPIRITWNSLLNVTELNFVPGPPTSLQLSDEIVFSLSIMTAATRRDRKILRCDSNGVLLVGDPWNGLIAVENDDLVVSSGAADSFIASVENKGVLVATTAYITRTTFVRVSGGSSEVILIAPETNFWYTGPVYSVTVDDTPSGQNYSFFVGITAFN